MRGFLLGLLVLGLAASGAPRPLPPRAPAFLSGAAMNELHPGHDAAAYRRALDAIQGLGARVVLLPVYGYVDSAAAAGVDSLFEPPVSPAEYRAFVATQVRAAHARGLSVLLIPYLNVRRESDTEWRGNLAPPDWPAWFRSYRRWLAGWVELARVERVEWLAVGAELVSAEAHTEEWNRIVEETRRAYHGRVLYSCNWDHYREVLFADRLDLVGISAYYSLPWDAPTTFDAFRANWVNVREALREHARRVKRPLLITEIGFPSVRDGYRDPWNYLKTGAPAPEEQAEAFRIFAEIWRDAPELAGALVWCYSPFRGGPDDTGYSIQGKPAEAVVRGWFAARAAAGPRAAAGAAAGDSRAH